MSSYKGSLKIAATADIIDAVFQVDDNNLIVSTGGEPLGSWPLYELQPDDTGTEVLLMLDGESVAVTAIDHIAFSAALTPTKGRRRARHAKPKRSRKPEPRAETSLQPAKVKPSRPKLSKPKLSKPNLPTRKPDKPRSDKPKRNLLDTVARLVRKETWQEWLSDSTVRWVIASVAVMIVAGLAVFATSSLGMILILLGMVSLIIAALAVSDDLSAYSWIPGNLSEVTLVIAGAVAMAVGGLLILIS